jgi:hypothetical protein
MYLGTGQGGIEDANHAHLFVGPQTMAFVAVQGAVADGVIAPVSRSSISPLPATP